MSQIKPPLPEPAHTVKVWGLAEETYTAGQMHFYADTCTAALSARVAELEADAKRYRWLCEQEMNHAPVAVVSGNVGTWGECGHSSFGGIKELVDAAIDAAMKEQT